MKLITYEFESVPRAGVVADEQVLEVAALLKEQGATRCPLAAGIAHRPADTAEVSFEFSARYEEYTARRGSPVGADLAAAHGARLHNVRGTTSAGGTRKLSDAWYVVEIEVEGIGVLRNTIAPKVNSNLKYRFKAPAPRTPARSR